MMDVCFANIPDFNLHCLDFLWHLDLFTEESKSEEEETDDSPKGSSDDWSDDTLETSSHGCFCSGSMNASCEGLHFFDGLLDFSTAGLLLPEPLLGSHPVGLKTCQLHPDSLAGAMTGPF